MWPLIDGTFWVLWAVLYVGPGHWEHHLIKDDYTSEASCDEARIWIADKLHEDYKGNITFKLECHPWEKPA